MIFAYDDRQDRTDAISVRIGGGLTGDRLAAFDAEYGPAAEPRPLVRTNSMPRR
jgi:hypothetical protein